MATTCWRGPHTHLAWLGDIFAIPSVVPLANAVSIGDVLIVLGTVAFVYRSLLGSARRLGPTCFDPCRTPAFGG